MLMAAFTEGTRDGGIPWASVYAIFPNVEVMSKAAIAAVVIGHGNGGLTDKKKKSGSGIQYRA
jgi:hypothetical protein